MAGLSRRFAEAGYALPKYRLPLHGRTVFEHAVSSFEAYFSDTPFLFVTRAGQGAEAFVRGACAAMGVADARVVELERPTRGQAETVALGVRAQGEDAAGGLTIFNIDTFRPGFRHPPNVAEIDGYLEVFRGSGANWSYVRPRGPGDDRAAETTEKRPVSDLCCTGLYHFASAERFLGAFDAAAAAPAAELQGGELYVAPLYNRLIAEGCDIRWTLVERAEVQFCGTPGEYEALAAGS